MNKIDSKLLDEIASQCKTKEDIFGENGIVQEFIKRTLQRALDAELEEHLGYAKHEAVGKNSGNSRNGRSKKLIKGSFGELEIEPPRDRNSTFEPQIIPKHQTRFDGFDDKIIALYAKGMTTRDIQKTLQELYGVEVSHSLISRVTENVMDEVKAWQIRPLDPVYPIIYLDCIVVKVRHDGQVINKSIYLALGVTMDGHKDLLGLWIAENEGAKFWLSVLTELQSRGIQTIHIACVDGLKGFPDAINGVFPETRVQLCIVHLVRHSLKYVASKHMKAVAADLKRIYQSTTVSEAEDTLNAFAEKWDGQYVSISKSWRNNWHNLITLFDFPKGIRKVIYTTNAIESLNMVIRKAIRNRRIFPNDDSALKVVYLAIVSASKKWTMPIHDWKPALNCFSIQFNDRLLA